MTRCYLCGQPCIPLADYDRPVCIPCDREHEAMLQLVHHPPRRPKQPRRAGVRLATSDARPLGTLPKWAADLPPSTATGPGDPAAIAALMAEMDAAPDPRRRLRLINGAA